MSLNKKPRSTSGAGARRDAVLAALNDEYQRLHHIADAARLRHDVVRSVLEYFEKRGRAEQHPDDRRSGWEMQRWRRSVANPTAKHIPLTQRLKLPPEYEARMRGIVATSVGLIRNLRPDWYFARLDRPTHLRIYFGHLIVITLEGAYVWMAIDEAVLGDRDRLLVSWVWDEPELRPLKGEAYPRYKSPASRNGFYDPARDANGAEWSFIEVAHHAYLRNAATHGRAPDHRTKSDPNLIDEIDGWQPYGMNHIALEHAVRESLRDTEARRTRLASAPKKPRVRPALTLDFVRNADVIAEVLHRSRGCCEGCLEPAPFMRANDGTPYLEVHHRVRLADGGDDTVENAVALCPNCHRKAHYG